MNQPSYELKGYWRMAEKNIQLKKNQIFDLAYIQTKYIVDPNLKKKKGNKEIIETGRSVEYIKIPSISRFVPDLSQL